MKYRINPDSPGEAELILNYSEITPEVERVLRFMKEKKNRLTGKVMDETVTIEPDEILYIESVDDKTFAYTMDEVIRLEYSLVRLEEYLESPNFFRCSKSMILNVNKVERLKSLPSNRIDARMQGGEHIMISRTYASDFRRLLRGGEISE